MLNPITYTEKIVRSFLKYQLTAYPFSDPRLHAQMRELLNLDRGRHTPLLRGPYVSLSRSFRQGAAVPDLVAAGVFHAHMRRIIPEEISHLYGHQERAIRAIHAGKTTLVSTGTGSGKTECFLYPVISTCLELRDSGAPAGICAVIVYPMNALAEDQLDRLRGLLAGSGVTFGMYVGKTPEHEREVSGHRMPGGSSRADYREVLERYRGEGRPDAVHPAEEICSRERMRTPGCQPRILLTNVKQLELLLTRGADVELFDGARLDYLVFDEAHTFTGLQGAETACLIRRLRAFCGPAATNTACIATSATIVDAEEPDAARKFAGRFFGVDANAVACVNEEYEADLWPDGRAIPSAPADPGAVLARALKVLEQDETGSGEIRDLYARLTGVQLGDGAWSPALHTALRGNELAYLIRQALNIPKGLEELARELSAALGREVGEEEIVTYLAMGAAAVTENRPIFRPVVHAFVRGIPGAVVSFPQGDEPKL